METSYGRALSAPLSIIVNDLFFWWKYSVGILEEERGRAEFLIEERSDTGRKEVEVGRVIRSPVRGLDILLLCFRLKAAISRRWWCFTLRGTSWSVSYSLSGHSVFTVVILLERGESSQEKYCRSEFYGGWARFESWDCFRSFTNGIWVVLKRSIIFLFLIKLSEYQVSPLASILLYSLNFRTYPRTDLDCIYCKLKSAFWSSFSTFSYSFAWRAYWSTEVISTLQLRPRIINLWIPSILVLGDDYTLVFFSI